MLFSSIHHARNIQPPVFRWLNNSTAVLFAPFPRHSHTGNCAPIPIPPSLSSLETAEHNALARDWIARFQRVQIPKNSVELAFSRSSGPGGQNVNKVNTKATLRCPIHEEWIPLWARPELRRSSYYVSSSQLIQITSTVHRSQAQNITECLSKFHALILSSASSTLKNEPSEAQKKRVQGLVKASNAKRRADKTHRSNVKTGRKKPALD